MKPVFKTNPSISYIIFILMLLMILVQIDNFINLNFFDLKSWLKFGVLAILYSVYELYLYKTFIVYNESLLIKKTSLLFFKKSDIYKLDEIEFVNVRDERSKGIIPKLTIKLKNNKVETYRYSLISTKNIKKLSETLINIGVTVNVITPSGYKRP